METMKEFIERGFEGSQDEVLGEWIDVIIEDVFDLDEQDCNRDVIVVDSIELAEYLSFKEMSIINRDKKEEWSLEEILSLTNNTNQLLVTYEGMGINYTKTIENILDTYMRYLIKSDRFNVKNLFRRLDTSGKIAYEDTNIIEGLKEGYNLIKANHNVDNQFLTEYYFQNMIFMLGAYLLNR